MTTTVANIGITTTGTLNIDMGSNSLRTVKDLGAWLEAFSSGAKFGTVDVNSTTSGASVSASGTLTFASVAAGEVIAVGGTRFYAVSGTAVVANYEFKRGVSDTADAASFVTTFNSLMTNVATASSSLGVITINPVTKGAQGNGISVQVLGAMASGTVTYSSATGTLTTTINGVAVTATAGASDTLSAVAMVTAINASSNALVSGFVFATSAAGVVTIYSLRTGLYGNTITLASAATGGTATASGARLTGGAIAQGQGVQASGTLTISSGSGTVGGSINGVSVTVSYNTSDTQTATDLTAAINASTNALVRGLVTATSSSGVVTITSVRGGKDGNAITLSATGTGVTASGARLTSGAAPTHAVFVGTAANTFQGGYLASGSGVNGALAAGTNDLIF